MEDTVKQLISEVQRLVTEQQAQAVRKKKTLESVNVGIAPLAPKYPKTIRNKAGVIANLRQELTIVMSVARGQMLWL
eukprot:5120223-Amphidinium_carterae.1